VAFAPALNGTAPNSSPEQQPKLVHRPNFQQTDYFPYKTTT
jgi:hypothetical protein